MRPIWTGSISFGLVNIPVKLYLAAKSERFSFRMLHRPDEGPIQFRRFCSLEEKEVAYEDIVRGYEYERGRFVVVEDGDFDRIERAASRMVEVQQFVRREEIDPVFFETPYYLEPTKGAEKAYALLREALRRSQKVGIGRVVLREREYVAAVHLVGGALCMSTLRYASELRSAEALGIPSEGGPLPEKQLELALMLIDQLSAPYDPQAFRDDYHERVSQMIQEKLAGLPAPAKAPAAAPAQVVDLAEVLQRSIDEAKQKAQGERRAPRQVAARESRRRRPKK
ncbi:MAG: Ku protein [Deltaproteobacteria bacterium]|nr:Ku protein [Deltaproteobacteria bacterium]